MCKIFYDRYFLNAQFVFHFLIVCYEIHLKLIHIKFNWIETIIYRVNLNEMFVRNYWFMLACFDFVKIFVTISYFAIMIRLHVKIWRNVWRMFVTCLFLFICSDFDEMFATIIYFANSIVLTCLNRVRCSVNHLVCLIRQICFQMFFAQMFRSNAFHIENSIKNCLHERRFFYNFYSIYNIFVLILFSSRCSIIIEIIFSFLKTWWNVKQCMLTFNFVLLFIQTWHVKNN